MESVYLSKNTWSNLFTFLDSFPGIRTKNRQKLKKFLRGIFWILRTGAQWRELPKRYGKYRSVHKRYSEWSRKGVWQSMLNHVSEDLDGEWIMLDATIVRAHPCSVGCVKDSQAEEGLGRSKGGYTSKIHALVDALGNPLKFSLTGGQRHDITQAPKLIEGIEGVHVLGDKAYDSDAFIEQIKNQNCQPVIPPRSNRKSPRTYDEDLYKERHLIEIFFRKIKNFRRVFSRFDKYAQNYMGFVAFASTLIWLK